MILKSGILTLQSLMETGVLLLDDSALGHPRNGGPGIIIIIAHPIPLSFSSPVPYSTTSLSSNLPSTLNIALDIEIQASLSNFGRAKAILMNLSRSFIKWLVCDVLYSQPHHP